MEHKLIICAKTYIHKNMLRIVHETYDLSEIILDAYITCSFFISGRKALTDAKIIIFFEHHDTTSQQKNYRDGEVMPFDLTIYSGSRQVF